MKLKLSQRSFSENIGAFKAHKAHTSEDGPITDESLDVAARAAYGFVFAGEDENQDKAQNVPMP